MSGNRPTTQILRALSCSGYYQEISGKRKISWGSFYVKFIVKKRTRTVLPVTGTDKVINEHTIFFRNSGACVSLKI